MHDSYEVFYASPMKDGFLDGSEKKPLDRSYASLMVIYSLEVFFCFLALWECNVLAFYHKSKVSGTISFKRERGVLADSFSS